MTKSELIEALAERSGESKAAVERVVNALADVVIEGLKAGGEATLPGLGKFEAKHRAARTMRNPATGGSIEKPATMVASFKPGKPFKDAVAAFPAG